MRPECKGRKPIFDGSISLKGEQTANKMDEHSQISDCFITLK
jgi:hypothetical protein